MSYYFWLGKEVETLSLADKAKMYGFEQLDEHDYERNVLRHTAPNWLFAHREA